MLSSRECSSKPSTDRPTGLYLNPEYALMNSGRRCRIPLCKYKLIYLPHQSKLLMKRWRTNGETENCCCFCTWDFLVNVWSIQWSQIRSWSQRPLLQCFSLITQMFKSNKWGRRHYWRLRTNEGPHRSIVANISPLFLSSIPILSFTWVYMFSSCLCRFPLPLNTCTV